MEHIGIEDIIKTHDPSDIFAIPTRAIKGKDWIDIVVGKSRGVR